MWSPTKNLTAPASQLWLTRAREAETLWPIGSHSKKRRPISTYVYKANLFFKLFVSFVEFRTWNLTSEADPSAPQLAPTSRVKGSAFEYCTCVRRRQRVADDAVNNLSFFL